MLTVVILLAGLAVAAIESNSQLTVDPLTGPVIELEEEGARSNSSSDGHLLKMIRRELHHPHRHQCPINPDPRSPHLQRRSLCPFDIQRDINPLRIPDVIHRAHCLCESSPCSAGQSQSQSQQPARCLSLVSPLKVAYLDPQLKLVVATEVIHVPVACICAAQPAGRHMPANRNIVV
jgi:hypothetical protein